jgi:DNA invertase Pin-like site-specific DNA recombinase
MQSDKDDLPMQKRACHEFIEKMPGWVLHKEYVEIAKSGYHLASEERDMLEEMRGDAVNGEFDVLLVFMFDRLGRREDETPFIIQWLDQIGVEVWSVQEGRQEFKDSTDKLVNYIRFWAAGGESELTSIRVAQKHLNMTKEGVYRGGAVAFGYKLVWSGNKNRDGRELKKIEIDEDKAQWVRKIYHLCANENIGTYGIADYLRQNGVVTPGGKPLDAGRVRKILRNPVYKGYLVIGKTKVMRDYIVYQPKEDWIYSEHIDSLAIVSEELWEDANQKMDSRRTETTRTSLPPKYQPLFHGMLHCGFCGGKMGLRTCKGRETTLDSEEKAFHTTYQYSCDRRIRKRHSDGKSVIGCKKLDNLILHELALYLQNYSIQNLSASLQEKRDNILSGIEAEIALTNQRIDSAKINLGKMNREIAKCLLGKSKFKEEDIIESKKQLEKESKESAQNLEKLNRTLRKTTKQFDALKKIGELAPLWDKEFQKADADAKKTVLAYLIEKVSFFGDCVTIDYAMAPDDIRELLHTSSGLN